MKDREPINSSEAIRTREKYYPGSFIHEGKTFPPNATPFYRVVTANLEEYQEAKLHRPPNVRAEIIFREIEPAQA